MTPIRVPLCWGKSGMVCHGARADSAGAVVLTRTVCPCGTATGFTLKVWARIAAGVKTANNVRTPPG
jgi:hypothetical protein